MYIHYIDLSDHRDIERSYNIHTQLVNTFKVCIRMNTYMIYVYIYIFDIYIYDIYIYTYIWYIYVYLWYIYIYIYDIYICIYIHDIYKYIHDLYRYIHDIYIYIHKHCIQITGVSSAYSSVPHPIGTPSYTTFIRPAGVSHRNGVPHFPTCLWMGFLY